MVELGDYQAEYNVHLHFAFDSGVWTAQRQPGCYAEVDDVFSHLNGSQVSL